MCDGSDKNFIVVNQKGVDPISLDLFAREGVSPMNKSWQAYFFSGRILCFHLVWGLAENRLSGLCAYKGGQYSHRFSGYHEMCYDVQVIYQPVQGWHV